MKANIKYSEIYKQVLGIVLIPLIYSGVFIVLVLNMDIFHPSELVKSIIILGGPVVLIAVSVITVMRMIMIDATMEYDIRGIHFHLNKRSFIFPHAEFFINYSNIENAALNIDAKERAFATINIKSPKRSIIVGPVSKKTSDDFISFWNRLDEQISDFNESNTEHPALLIKHKGFYEGGFIKFLAYFSMLMAVFFTLLKFIVPSKISTWQLIAFYCYALPFLAAVFQSNKRSEEATLSGTDKKN